MVVEFFEVVVGGFKWLQMVLGGFRSFHVLVTTRFIHPALLNEGCDASMYVCMHACMHACMHVCTKARTFQS